MDNEEKDGALPISVEYRTFRQMFSKLHTAIQAGLSDVVNEVFSKGLITPHVKSVVENLSIAAPSRVSTLLDALHHRIKTNSEAFDEFAHVLESIESFVYLAKNMRELKIQEAEKEKKRIEDIRKENEKQTEMRQVLQLPVDSSSAPMKPAVHPEAYSSPMYSTDRRIDNNPISTPVVVNRGFTPQKFSGPVSVLTTPNLGPSTSLSNFSSLSISEKFHQASLDPLFTIESSQVESKVEPKAISMVVTEDSKLNEAPSEGSLEMPIVTTAVPPGSVNLSKEDSYPLLPLPEPASSGTRIPLEVPIQVKREEQLSAPPDMVTIAPTPNTSLHLSISQLSSSIDEEHSTFVGLRPHRSGSFTNLRTLSVESSVSSTSSADYFTPPSSLVCEEENVAQELADSTHNTESLVGTKLQRSISCEECSLKKLKVAERTIAKLQLETSGLVAAYESNAKKLLKDTGSLQSEIYLLKLALYQHQMANVESQKRLEVLFHDNQRITAENRHLKEELKTVKASAYDKLMAIDIERSKIHRCPVCTNEFYYPSCV